MLKKNDDNQGHVQLWYLENGVLYWPYVEPPPQELAERALKIINYNVDD